MILALRGLRSSRILDPLRSDKTHKSQCLSKVWSERIAETFSASQQDAGTDFQDNKLQASTVSPDS